MNFFARHLFLLGKDNFEFLNSSCVLIAGIGGLGCIVAELLVRTGVRKLILIDKGKIDEPDLNRQIFYTIDDIGKYKVEIAQKRLYSIFRDKFLISIKAFNEKISLDLLEKIFEKNKINVIADCLDNYESRFIIDEFSFNKDIPLVHGGVNSLYGQVITITHQKIKRLKDIFKGLDQKQSSIINVFPQSVFVIGTIQSIEIIKIIINKKENNIDKILTIDLFEYSIDRINPN